MGPDEISTAGLWGTHAVMLSVQLGFAVVIVLSKFVLDSGVGPEVQLLYKSFFALCVLIPFAYFREQRSPLHWKTLATWFGVLGIIGFTTQYVMLFGLALGTASLGSVIPISIPVCVFFISAVFRLEEFNIRGRDGQAKIGGMFTAIAGAVLMSVYQGSVILGTTAVDEAADQGPDWDPSCSLFASCGSPGSIPSPPDPSSQLSEGVWRLALILLLFDGLLYAIMSTLQVPLLIRYPSPVSITAYVMGVQTVLFGVATPFSISSLSDLLIPNFKVLAAIVFLGAVGTGAAVALQSWAIHKVGPLLPALYNPIQAVATTLLSHMIFGDVVYLGSVLGTLLIIAGIFLISFGRAQTQTAVVTIIPVLTEPTVDIDAMVPVANSYAEITKDLHEPLMAPA